MVTVQAEFCHESFKLISGQRPDFKQSSWSMQGCQNDWVACSLIIQASEYAILLKRPRALFSEKGPRPIIRLEVDCPGLGPCVLRIAGQFICEDDVPRADILFEDDTAELRPWLPTQLFLTISIPAGTPAGEYAGKVRIFLHRMFEDEQILEDLVFSVKVHPVALPERRRFFLNLWQHLSNIARKHETSLFSDEHFAVLESYVRALSMLGNKVATIIASEIPWSGQGCFMDIENRSDFFEYNYIRVTRDADEVFHYDYSVVERYIDLCDRYGVAEEIGIFGLIRIWQSPENGYGPVAQDDPDAIRICYLDQKDGTLRYMRSATEISQYITAFHDWLDMKGWLDRAVIIADEPPDMVQFAKSLARLKSAGPRFKIQVDVTPDQLLNDLHEPVHNYTPLISDPAEQPELFRKCQTQITGRLQLSACCTPPYPNQFLRSPLVETTLLAYLSAFLGVDGYLRWNFTAWPANPRENMVFRPGQWESGDTCFVYPSRGGNCLLSLRFFAMKRAIDLYELILLVREKRADHQDIMQRIYDKVIREQNYSNWHFDYDDDRSRLYSLNPDDYEAARVILIKALAEPAGGQHENRRE